ncbi:hypothetical protein SDC9_158409 [bioreactor metagenome]|uniref:Uncharacterized protein n=1 Tax=bioreactor metagenome TaxID=1076179 RepID=A0A645F9Q4_9ZZZZ
MREMSPTNGGSIDGSERDHLVSVSTSASGNSKGIRTVIGNGDHTIVDPFRMEGFISDAPTWNSRCCGCVT